MGLKSVSCISGLLTVLLNVYSARDGTWSPTAWATLDYSVISTISWTPVRDTPSFSRVGRRMTSVWRCRHKSIGSWDAGLSPAELSGESRVNLTRINFSPTLRLFGGSKLRQAWRRLIKARKIIRSEVNYRGCDEIANGAKGSSVKEGGRKRGVVGICSGHVSSQLRGPRHMPTEAQRVLLHCPVVI
jgi:hypothetical protein